MVTYSALRSPACPPGSLGQAGRIFRPSSWVCVPTQERADRFLEVGTELLAHFLTEPPGEAEDQLIPAPGDSDLQGQGLPTGLVNDISTIQSGAVLPTHPKSKCRPPLKGKGVCSPWLRPTGSPCGWLLGWLLGIWSHTAPHPPYQAGCCRQWPLSPSFSNRNPVLFVASLCEPPEPPE